jgi:threonylcarbamoyladenosine tRNA methylthiotransferase MtaB
MDVRICVSFCRSSRRDPESDLHCNQTRRASPPATRSSYTRYLSSLISRLSSFIPPPAVPTFKTITLGCKVNQYETEYVRQALERLGYRDAVAGEAADLCLVNTCTVTSDGDAKSRKAVRTLHRHHPQADIVVMGCYATRAAAEVAALPGVVEVITDKRELPQWLARLGLVDVPDGIATFGSRHRAYVKVQDGCQMPCSYCIIPKVRPVLQSRPVEEVVEEVRRLVAHGHREIVLTGIHLGHYGVDLADGQHNGPAGRPPSPPAPLPEGERGVIAGRPPTLARLVHRLTELDGNFRVRLSSMEAAEATAELIAVLRERPDRVCPHVHLAMQSGSDAVLERMRRRWPARRFLQQCLAVRQALGDPALTTDVIVGFPGETEADFAATCRLVEEVGFSKLHIFRFSPRRGTPAADLPDRVPGPVQQQRAAALAELGEELRRRYFQRLVGRRLQVLVESPIRGDAGRLLGTSGEYAPVELAGGPEQVGQLIEVTAGAVADGRILAAGTAPRISCTSQTAPFGL